MEAVHLLTLGMAFIVLAAIFRQGTTTRRRDRTTIRVSDAAVARRALIDHADAFSNRPTPAFPAGRPVTHSIASMPYGPVWQTLRRNLTANILHHSRLGDLAQLEHEAAAAAASTLSAEAGSGDVVVVPRDTLHGAVLTLFARLCFGDGGEDGGMDVPDMHTVLQMQQEFFNSFAVVMASERSWMTRLLHWWWRRRQAGMFDRIDEVFIPAIVARRRRRSRHGNCCGGGFRPYLDSLLELDIPDGDGDNGHARRRLLTDQEIAFLVWEFLGAGISGAVTCLEWTLAHLAAEPGIQDKLRRELIAGDQRSMTGSTATGTATSELLRLPYLHAVVLESLRLHPPLPFASREVQVEGIMLGEVAVPPGGAPVSFVLGDIGRDGKVWTKPDKFRPERFLEGGEGEGVSLVPGPKEIKMMPFGTGRRHCSGVAMGMAHVKCFLAELVRGLEWVAPADDGGGIDFTEIDGFIKWMKTPLRVRIAPRSMMK
ncbi:unnamed protein product [Urochloa decumbens]|uniref:Uncharacterized protein n=1 Tax=Urochloa decumbens TaxID=240449 RepID=A0ABC9D8S9_9POAL